MPLWGRQIPYTVVKFTTFEKTVEQIYGYLGNPKSSYTTLQQTGVSFLGGYIAGLYCASFLPQRGLTEYRYWMCRGLPSSGCHGLENE